MTTLDEHLARAKALIRSGRYERHVARDDKAFYDIDTVDTEVIEGMDFMPYFDQFKKKLIYGTFLTREDQTRFYYVSFLNFDYFYGAETDFTWFDIDHFGFDMIE